MHAPSMTPTTPTPRSQRADRVLICRPFRAAYPSERRLTAPSYGSPSPNYQPSAAGLVSFVSLCESRIAPSTTLWVGSAGAGRESRSDWHEAFAGVVRPDALSRGRRTSLTPRAARPPSLIWRESSERLACLNDEAALVALDHVLEFQVFVPWDEEETAIPPANAQVVQDAHGEALCACIPSAFAEKVKLGGVLSALPKLLFVLGLPPCSLDLGTRHRATQRTRL